MILVLKKPQTWRPEYEQCENQAYFPVLLLSVQQCKASLTPHASSVLPGVSVSIPGPAAASTMDGTTLWMLQPQYPVLSLLLMRKTQQPG